MTDPDNADLGGSPRRGSLVRTPPFWWVLACAVVAMAAVLVGNVFVLSEIEKAAAGPLTPTLAWMITGTALFRVAVIGVIAFFALRYLGTRREVAMVRSEAELAAQVRDKLERENARADAAIAELQHTAVALRGSEQRFRDIAEVAADVVWETDAEHRFTLLAGGSDDELRLRIGIDPSMALGRTRWELAGADPESDEHWRRHKLDLDSHHPLRQFRYTVTTPAGERCHYVVNGKPVFDHEGNFVGYRGVGTNESEMFAVRLRAERAEALLRDAVDSISEGFVIYDSEDRLVMCNEAFRKLYEANADMIVPGARYEDILRSGLARGLYEDARGREEEWLADRLKRRVNPVGSVEAKLSSGRWLMISERRMSDGGIAGLRIDITAMKAVQAALRESEARLHRAQRMAKLSSDSRDLRTEQMIWSDETYRILGVDRETFKLDLANVLALIHPDDHAIVLGNRAAAQKGECPPPTEFRIVRPDGTIRYVRREVELLHDAAGKAVMLSGTLQDITDLRASQARERELERQLQHSQRLKALGTLAGGIAHDLNNTLVPILSLSKMVAQRLPAGSIDREDLETITFASERARDLLQQILAFSRKENAVKTVTDLASVARRTVQMMRATAPPKIQIVESLEEVPPLMADGGQLQQVIVNLVTNSIQAIGKAAGKVTVGVAPAVADAAGDRGPALALTVADTGRGMDAATMERIYEPFYTTKAVGEGTGLGLSVVHGIISAHGGQIDVKSAPGKGTLFTITLPIGSPEPGRGRRDATASSPAGTVAEAA